MELDKLLLIEATHQLLDDFTLDMLPGRLANAKPLSPYEQVQFPAAPSLVRWQNASSLVSPSFGEGRDLPPDWSTLRVSPLPCDLPPDPQFRGSEDDGSLLRYDSMRLLVVVLDPSGFDHLRAQHSRNGDAR